MGTQKQTISIETFARRSYNYLENMVDADGLPYFNIFWTEPAQAAHDWPDFGDVMSRQYQATVMARTMTGIEVATEKTWRKKLLSMIDGETGLLTRPDTTFSKLTADPGDNFLTLYALVTAYADQKDENLHKTIIKMIDKMLESTSRQPKSGGFLNGFGIKSVMACLRVTGYEPALDLARKIVSETFNTSAIIYTRQYLSSGWAYAREPAKSGWSGGLCAVGEGPGFI